MSGILFSTWNECKYILGERRVMDFNMLPGGNVSNRVHNNSYRRSQKIGTLNVSVLQAEIVFWINPENSCVVL